MNMEYMLKIIQVLSNKYKADLIDYLIKNLLKIIICKMNLNRIKVYNNNKNILIYTNKI